MSQADEVRTICQDYIFSNIEVSHCTSYQRHLLMHCFVMGFGSLQSIREQKLLVIPVVGMGYVDYLCVSAACQV